MMEWTKMYGLAVEAAKVKTIGTSEFKVGREACCLRAVDGTTFIGVSYGDVIPAEYDAIRAALKVGVCSFDRIMVVDERSNMVEPNPTAITWLRDLGTNPATLYDKPAYGVV